MRLTECVGGRAPDAPGPVDRTPGPPALERTSLEQPWLNLDCAVEALRRENLALVAFDQAQRERIQELEQEVAEVRYVFEQATQALVLEARALAAESQLGELRQKVAKLEWVTPPGAPFALCPCCLRETAAGHGRDCWLSELAVDEYVRRRTEAFRGVGLEP